jgi:divalent metal cation (Fe/Co/Zn/Cd) transporter
MMQPEYSNPTCESRGVPRFASVLWLQAITVVWMVIECGVSLLAAATAHSPALLAFGSDSLVELLSAGVVVLQFSPRLSISERHATRAAAFLLFALAGIVAGIAILSLAWDAGPKESPLGIAVTVIAVIIMPLLGWLKRREARRLNNSALAADAVQSATCAYLAGVTLAGLVLNAAFHVGWFDSVAALIAVPILLKEGRQAWRGHSCCSCKEM